jgi:hypothetical protein
MRKLLLSLLVVCFSAGCQEKNSIIVAQPYQVKNEQKATNMMQEVTIKIGELGSEFQKRYPSQVKVNKQPAGLDFYSIDWDTRPRGTVKVDHDKFSLAIDDVLGVQTSIDLELPKEGFDSITVFAGLSTNNDQGLITHDEARDKLYAILKKIEQAGWKIITGRGDPRLKGHDRFNYVVGKDSSAGLGTDFLPSLEEWMRIENLTAWEFYADRQYLSVTFKRERTLLDPTKPGSYLLTYTLKSEAEHFRAYVGPDGRKRWKELLPNELTVHPPLRQKAEATLKAQGIKIDETYQDPPLPDLK